MLDQTTVSHLLAQLNTLEPVEVQKVIKYIDALASSGAAEARRRRVVERAVASVRLEGLAR